MSKRFSPSLLFRVRNEIPISALVADVLDLPSKFSEGNFRFLCPLCHEFNAATNPNTNLARCFTCRQNFNTIDITMIVRQSPFASTVEFLVPMLASKP